MQCTKLLMYFQIKSVLMAVTLRYLPMLPIIDVHRNHHWQTTSLTETQFSQSNEILVKTGFAFVDIYGEPVGLNC